MTNGLVGRRFKDAFGITHLVEHGAKSRRNVDPKVSLRKRSDVDCMGCLVGSR